MKKLFLSITILLLSFATKAQLQTSFGMGYNFNKHPIYSFNVGYEIKRININGGFMRSLTRSTSSTIIAGGEVGYNLFNEADAYLLAQSLIVSVGYWNIWGNSDQKLIKASWRPSVSIRYIRMLSENGGLFANAMYIRNDISLTAGMILKFQ